MSVIAVPATAFAQGTTTLAFPTTIDVVNPCTGEAVIGTGKAVIVMYLRPDNNGGVHVLSRFNVHGDAQAIAPQLHRYRYNLDTTVDQSYFPPVDSSTPREITAIFNQVLVRQAETTSPPLLATEDDFLLKQTFHVTMNANGVITAEVFNGHTSCPSRESEVE
jgi:hypothetical protein